mgnify:FL=1
MTPDSVDLDLMARTIYGEARGEPDEGWSAVAWVIRNRAAKGGWRGDTPAHVCLCRAQFSCWNKLDPNRQVIADLTLFHPGYRKALRIAGQVMDAPDDSDPIKGAMHYHVRGTVPPWVAGADSCATIGRHVFFNSIK